MSTADRITTEDRRRAILVALSLSPSYRLEPRALRRQIEAVNFEVSLDRLAMDCAWLAEMELVEAPPEGMVRLTDRGADVALGRIRVPGVTGFEPGERK